jgi:hypothetical protein
MIFAQITDNLIVNTIQIDDIAVVPMFTEGYDACVQIDNIAPQPAIGWSYDGTDFTNQATLPPIVSLDGVPSGSATTFDPFMLSAASNRYWVSINGTDVSVGCQIYDYVGLRYVLYMLLTQNAGSIGVFTVTPDGISQNNQFVVTLADAGAIYAVVCTLK